MKKGLTLVELIMVLAVLAIIGAILIPNFLSTTDKARLKSDIQSAQVIQNAIELYRSEHGQEVNGRNNVATIIANLTSQGYLKKGTVTIQTKGAVWQKDSTTGVIVIDITRCADSVKKEAYAQLSVLEKPYVVGGTGVITETEEPDESNEQ